MTDTGIGISAEDAERIFERFYRAKDPRVEKITGTGLGLTLAREVVRLHGGDITVDSELNKGSTFTLTLPTSAERRSLTHGTMRCIRHEDHRTKQGAVTVLKPTGPLTQADATRIQEHGDEGAGEQPRAIRGRHVSAIPFVDSRGLEALVEVTEEMTKSGQTLKLCAPNKTVREVLNLTGSRPLFEHFEDVNTAVRSFL